MRYVKARYAFHSRDLTYRIYITDALKVLGNLEVRYWDAVKPNVKIREPEEIISSIVGKLRKAEETK